MYSVIDIAKYVISYCMEMGTPISNLQLQKILYYLQVFFLRTQHEALYREEVYAWQHGPVIPEAYYLFSGYGASKIQNLYNVSLDRAVEAHILPVIEKLRLIAPWDLVKMTHIENGPWDMVYNQKIDSTGMIDKRLIAMDTTDLGV